MPPTAITFLARPTATEAKHITAQACPKRKPRSPQAATPPTFSATASSAKGTPAGTETKRVPSAAPEGQRLPSTRLAKPTSKASCAGRAEPVPTRSLSAPTATTSSPPTSEPEEATSLACKAMVSGRGERAAPTTGRH